MSPPSKRGHLIRVIVAGLLLLFAAIFVYRSVNTTHLNKIVLMFINPADFRIVRTVELDGGVKWEQAVSISGAIGPKRSTTVHVVDVHGAWFDGTVTLKDIEGTVIASVPITPHGRFGGTLVILVDADGKSFAAWNEVPDEKP